MACGGTRETIDTRAPKQIASEDMTLFDVTSALPWPAELRDGEEPLQFVSAFAAPAGEGTFLFLEHGSRHGGTLHQAWALVRGDVFPALVRLTRERDLAKENGHHSHTAGLPEDFGGSIRIRYADGEKIGVSDNQSPILSEETGRQIAALFEQAMHGEKLPLPDPAELTQIRFCEEREDGGFTRAVLTVHPDGTGTNAKAQRFDGPKIYEGEKPVDAQTVSDVREGMARSGILAWAGLPDSGFPQLSKKTLTFRFADGEEVVVPEGRLLPDQLSRGFFDIELELATKH